MGNDLHPLNADPALEPEQQQEGDSIFGFYKGQIEIRGNILAPLYSDSELEEFFRHSAAQFQ